MYKLSYNEKKAFATQIEDHVKLIHDFVYQSLDEEARNFRISEVGYGALMHDDYYYIDYPYSPGIDKLNDALITDGNELNKVDEILFSEFKEIQKINENNPKGFIYYEYDLNSIGFITKYYTNLPAHKDNIHKNICKFLPVIHYSVYMSEDFNYPVIYDATFSKATYRLLYLNKSLSDITRSTSGDKSHVITTAFVTNSDFHDVENLSIEKVVSKLYRQVFPFLESFYSSPLLLKLMEEKRKSNIRAYQHSYGNIAPDIRGFTQSVLDENYNISTEITKLKSCLQVLDLTMIAMFNSEADVKDAAPPNTKFPLMGKSIIGIFKHYYLLANYLEIEADIEITSKKTKPIDIIPKGKEIFDIHLIFWNLWENACRAAKRNDNKIYICVHRNENGSINVSLRNKGTLNSDLAEFINEDKSYPFQKSDYRSYKGLEIVKDRLKQKGWKWEYVKGWDEIAKSDTTEIILTINLA